MAHTRALINIPGLSIPIKPAAALAAKNRFVTYDTDSMSVVLSAANDDAAGVVYQAYGAAELGQMIIEGVVLVEAGAQVDPGNYVQASTLGVAIAATSTHKVLGRCVVGCAAAGELISVHLAIPHNSVV